MRWELANEATSFTSSSYDRSSGSSRRERPNEETSVRTPTNGARIARVQSKSETRHSASAIDRWICPKPSWLLPSARKRMLGFDCMNNARMQDVKNAVVVESVPCRQYEVILLYNFLAGSSDRSTEITGLNYSYREQARENWNS